MSEIDVMALLAEANPVRVADLAEMPLPGSVFARRPSTKLILATAIVVVIAGAAASIAVFASGGQSSQSPGSGPLFPILGMCRGPCGAPLQHPLGPASEAIPLALAPATLHAPVVLPDTPFVHPSDVGVVQGASKDGQSGVGISFPAQRLIVTYERPAIPDPLANYQDSVKSDPGTRVIYLGKVPALETTSADWNSIELVAGGTTIAVMGRPDLPTLQGVSQSIVDRPAASTLVPGGIKLRFGLPSRGQILLPDAGSFLGAPVVLPDPSLVNPANAKKIWAQGEYADLAPRSSRVLSIVFPSLRLIYERPAPWPHSRADDEQFAQRMPGGRTLDLNGVPAVASSGTHAIYFTVGGTRVVVAGHLAQAKLQAIAQSIVKRSRSK